MDAIYVGIDVSKDRLDVAMRPDGEGFAVSRTGAGIDELIERLKPLSSKLVAIEATGGFETVVAAGKPKLVAIIAVARKLLTILNAILRDKTPWQPKNP